MTMHTIEQFTLTNIGTTAELTKCEYCNINDNYTETEKQLFYKSCHQFLCDECHQNKKKHECILDPVRDEVLG
jgi:hypothetical protein